MLKKWFVFILLVCPMWGATAQQIFMLEDDSGDMSIQQVLSNPDGFQQTDKTAIGFSDSVFWLRVDLENPTSVQQTQVIQFDFHGLELVRNYRLTEQGFQTSEAGCLVPLEQRSMGLLLPSFQEVLMPGERRSHYVRVEGSTGIDLAYSVRTLSEAYAADRRHRMIAISVLVGLTTIGLYILVSGALIRSKLHGWYSGYLALLLLTYVFESQVFQLGDRAWSGLTSILGFAVAQFFMREFFKACQRGWAAWIPIVGLGIALLNVLLPSSLWLPAATFPLAPIMLLFIAFQLAVALRAKAPLALLISLGWLIFMVNAGISILAFNGFLETQWLLAYPIGLMVESLCFAVALSTSLRLKDQKNQALTHQLSELAYTDTLTGLRNRAGLKRELDLSDADRPTHAYGLFLLDLDHFKSVNDAYGHSVGDQLLAEIGQSITQCLPPGGLCARHGGEEFVVTVPWTTQSDFFQLGETLVAQTREATIQTGIFPVNRSVSIGGLHWETDMCFSTALRLVDECQRAAKEQGGNRCFYATDENHKAFRARIRNTSESRIRQGLKDGEFRYHVQPIYFSSHNDQSLVGFEVLLRWCQPSGSFVSPPDFVSSFDQVFFSEEFTQIRQSMREKVLNSLPLHKGLYVSWNFSAQQLVHGNFVDNLVFEFSELRQKFPFTCVIEVAETGLSSRIDEKNLIRNLAWLRTQGYQIALDDFGIEHSNIDRLTRLPLDIVKLDKSLLHVPTKNASVLIRSVIMLCRSLNLKIIGEGVESAAQASRLRASMVSFQQGFFHARPMDPIEFKA